MEIIVDANVLLAGLLKDATTRELLLDLRLNLFAPEYLLSEIGASLKNNPRIKKRIHLSAKQLQELFGHLTVRIQTVPAASYEGYYSEALSLAPHEEDAHYFALALFGGIPIWSNDKGFKKQDRIKVHSTGDLIELLGRHVK